MGGVDPSPTRRCSRLMNAMSTRQLPPLADEYSLFIATNFVGVGGYVVLLYDHALTFDDEVQYIWCRKKKLVAWLFLLNRYLMPLAFIVNIHAYTSPVWTPLLCKHFVRYEGATTCVGLAIASLMMALRITAIYPGYRFVVTIIGCAYIGMVGVDAWLLSTAGPVPQPSIIHACTMQFGATEHIGNWASAWAWIHLIYDTIVVILVILRARTIAHVNISGQSRLVTTLITDGLIYYSVILSAGLVLVVMILKAPTGIKYISAQLQQMITVTMMSRITLNLRKCMASQKAAQSDILTSATEYRLSPKPEHIRMANIKLPPRVVVTTMGDLEVGGASSSSGPYAV